MENLRFNLPTLWVFYVNIYLKLLLPEALGPNPLKMQQIPFGGCALPRSWIKGSLLPRKGKGVEGGWKGRRGEGRGRETDG